MTQGNNNNNACPSGDYRCSAQPGYDGPTGNGGPTPSSGGGGGGGSCADLDSRCASWVPKGYCAAGWTLSGQSIHDVVCPESCGACGSSSTDRLTSNQGCMASGLCLTSASGQYTACMQDDANIVVYASGKRPLWASNTQYAAPAPSKLCMQGDGNLVGESEAVGA